MSASPPDMEDQQRRPLPLHPVSTLCEEDSMWFIRDLTAKHVEMAAVFLMTKAWAIHPISLLEQKDPYHLTLAKLLFPKRVWKKETSVVREKGEK